MHPYEGETLSYKRKKRLKMRMIIILASFVGFIAAVLVTTLGVVLVPGYAEVQMEKMNQED